MAGLQVNEHGGAQPVNLGIGFDTNLLNIPWYGRCMVSANIN